MFWLLAREVLYLRGEISRDSAWDVMPDMFFHRDIVEVEKTDDYADICAEDGVDPENMDPEAVVHQDMNPEWSAAANSGW